MRPIAAGGVALSVGRSVALVSPSKTAAPIEWPFGMWIRVGRRKHVLDGDAHWRNLQIRFNRLFAAAMRPVVKLL